MKIIKDELAGLKEKFGDERRTKLVSKGISKFKEEDLTTKKFYQFRNYIFSQFTIMNLYYVYNLYGFEAVVKKVKQII